MATRARTPRALRKKKKSETLRGPKPGAVLPATENNPKFNSARMRRNIERTILPGNAELDSANHAPVLIEAGQLDRLISAIAAAGYEVIGPTVRDGAITYENINSSADLPAGWTDEQEPGRYRLKKTDSSAFFDYSLGAHSWKKYLHPCEVRLWAAEKQNGSFRILNHEPEAVTPRAFVGVRACELAAIKAQDRVLLGDKYRDPIYAARRENAFIVAVQCSHAAATCFCASVGSGPEVGAGFDLLLTELADAPGHRFVAEAGSDRGAKLLAQLETKAAPATDVKAVEAAVASASRQQRNLDTAGLKEFFYENFEHPQWDKIAARCLSCANCTMSCPTCFCTTVDDATDVSGTHAERWRRWDSCFTQSFSYIHGGSIRTSGKARYRQWMTHKLATWPDQFGNFGCVGCGRCITWCPAAIDITEEVRAMREGGNRADS